MDRGGRRKDSGAVAEDGRMSRNAHDRGRHPHNADSLVFRDGRFSSDAIAVAAGCDGDD